MLCVNEHNTPHSGKLDVFSDRSCFWIFGNQRKNSSELTSKKIRSLCAIAPPPMRLVTDLLSSGSCGFYTKRHRSVRLVQFCEEVFGVYELAAVCLGYGLK